MRELLRKEVQHPTGVFVHNDLMAVGVLEALSDSGLRCPEDMAIVGYNDAPLTAYVMPSLTTIQLPGYELGRFAADMALAQIDDPERSVTSISLPPRLIARIHLGRISSVGALITQRWIECLRCGRS